MWKCHKCLRKVGHQSKICVRHLRWDCKWPLSGERNTFIRTRDPTHCCPLRSVSPTRRLTVSHTTVNAAGQADKPAHPKALSSRRVRHVVQRSTIRPEHLFTVQRLLGGRGGPGLLPGGAKGAQLTWVGRRLAGSRGSRSGYTFVQFSKRQCAPCASWSLRFGFNSPWGSTVFLQTKNTHVGDLVGHLVSSSTGDRLAWPCASLGSIIPMCEGFWTIRHNLGALRLKTSQQIAKKPRANVETVNNWHYLSANISLSAWKEGEPSSRCTGTLQQSEVQTIKQQRIG